VDLVGPRWCLHSTATFECRDEVEEASIVSGEFVLSCGDAAKVYDFAKEAFDQVEAFGDCGVKGAPTCGCDSAWNDGFLSCCRDGVHSALAVIAGLSVISCVGGRINIYAAMA
jgi:hypothetical protein